MINEIKKDDAAHLKLLNKAINDSDISSLSRLMNNNKYSEDYLRGSFLKACSIGDLEIVKFLMTSKIFTPNALYGRGLDDIFRKKHEDVITWLIFDYKIFKSGAVEESLIEMSDREYAKHIGDLFEKRELTKKLAEELKEKSTIGLNNKLKV